jgi:hypothetical protein
VLPESWARWDAQLDRWQGVTVFSLSIYLRHMGEIDILTVEDGRGPVAAFPVPVLAKNGARTIARPTYVSPYFPILFRPDDGPPTRAERRRRAAVDALLDDIKRRYAGIVLPLHPNVTDMVPFQRAGVELELRTTYKLPMASRSKKNLRSKRSISKRPYSMKTWKLERNGARSRTISPQRDTEPR